MNRKTENILCCVFILVIAYVSCMFLSRVFDKMKEGKAKDLFRQNCKFESLRDGYPDYTFTSQNGVYICYGISSVKSKELYRK